MPVIQVHERQKLEPDHVYVIPPDRKLDIVDHQIVANRFDEPHGKRLPIKPRSYLAQKITRG